MQTPPWKRIPNKHYFLVILALGIALFCSFSFIIFRHYQNSEKLSELALNDAKAIRESRQLLFDMLNLETGVRGYLLTGRRKFIEPYELGQKDIPKQIEILRPVIATSVPENDPMDQWLEKIQELQVTMQRQVDAYNHGGHDTFSANVLELQKVQMDDLRKTLEDFISRRLNILQLRTQEIKHEEKKFTLLLVLGTILAIVAMSLAVGVILTLIKWNQKAKADAAESEERFLTIMNGINDGVYDWYPEESDGKLYLSPGFKEMLGYSDADFPNSMEMFSQCVHPDDREGFWAATTKYRQHELAEYNNQFRMLHKNGGWKWILARGVGFWDESGAFIRLTGTLMDITEQKRREDELMQANFELETFTYVASHDLRSPLVNLKGFAKELHIGLNAIKSVTEEIDSALTPEQQGILHQSLGQDIPEALGFIEKATDRMDRLTSAVLDLSRVGKREYRIEWIDVEGIVKKCLAAQAYEINRTKVEVDCSALPAVHCDALALEQVFANLIDNAVKYMDPARDGRIKISAEDRPADIIYTISDNGRGIDPADQKKIFEMFRRARNTGDVRGTGMGMSFVRATLRKMGGSIWCESAPGIGSAFHIRIPKRLSRGLAA